jgi:hypothetical protein
MKNLLAPILFSAFLCACNNQPKTENIASASAGGGLDRTALPIHEPKRQTSKELDVRNVTAPPRFEVKAPACSRCID